VGPFVRATGACSTLLSPAAGRVRHRAERAQNGTEPVAGGFCCPGYRVDRQECRRPRPHAVSAPLAALRPLPVLPRSSTRRQWGA
jgi:hypothetical protein